MTRKKATIKDRNTLFDILSRKLDRGQSMALHASHRLEYAAREFEAEGLVQITDAGIRDGEMFRIIRNF